MTQERADLLIAVLNYVTRNGFASIDAENLATELPCTELEAQSYLEDLVLDGYLTETSPLSYDLMDSPRERINAEILKELMARVVNLEA